MNIHLHTIGLVVQDMPKALAFYRLLGLAIPADDDYSPHVEYEDETGYTIGFVSEALVRQSDPKWTDGFGNRVNLQFKLASPEAVDALYKKTDRCRL